MPCSSSEDRDMMEIVHKDEEARLGTITTPHGKVETPVFIPVGTKGTVKAILPRDLEEMGVQLIQANAYHLYLKPGDSLIRELGGLHRFAGWSGAILTDSGGYQVFSLALLRKVEKEGILFQSHIDGSTHFITPERAIEIQRNLGSDIMMCLDDCIPYPSSLEDTRRSVELTTEWARKCKKARDGSGILFAIVQGGFFKDLRLRSASELLEEGFDGYAIGGLSVGEPKGLMWEMVDTVLPLLPWDRPRYLMGLGFPEDVMEGVKRGIDMFDCIIPTRLARGGSLLTSKGRINIKNAAYARDENPLDEACDCYTCKNFSRAYLRHLFLSKELSSHYLNTIHNLSFYSRLIVGIRNAIRKGSFLSFYKEFMENWKGGEKE